MGEIRVKNLAEISMTLITRREGEYLYWALHGKTAWETGVILSTTESTASKMIQSATRKLEAPNKFAAALKALKLGLIPECTLDGSGEKLGRAESLDVCTWRALELTPGQIATLSFTHLHTWSTGIGKIHDTDDEGYIMGVTIWATIFAEQPVGIQWRWGAHKGVLFILDMLKVEANFSAELSIHGSPPPRQDRQLMLASLVGQLRWQEAVRKVVAEHPQIPWQSEL